MPARLTSGGSAVARVSATMAAYVLYAIIALTLVEAWRSESPLRWLVTVAGVAYAVCTYLLWRRIGNASKAWLSTLVLVLLLVLSVWRLGSAGAEGSLTVLGISVATLVTLAVVGAIVTATYILWTVRWPYRFMRFAFLLLAAHSLLPFVVGFVRGQGFDAIVGDAIGIRWFPRWLGGTILGAYLLLPLGLITAVARLISVWRVRSWTAAKPYGLAAVAIVLSILLTIPDGARHARTDVPPTSLPPTPNLQALMNPEKLLAALEIAGKLAAATPPATYDVAALARELGPDVDKLLTFVRDKVRYEVYGGVLRGPRGTLMALAGNAYDKSGLLAALLTQHGLDVRYVRARLSDERATALVSQMFAMAARPSRDPPAQAIRDAANGVSGSLREFGQVTFAHWQANADLVGRALERAKVRLGDQPTIAAEALLAEAADHVYLEYRKGDEWIPLDPTFEGARPGQLFANAVERLDGFPQSMHHRVAIRVRVEQRAGDKISVEDALRYDASAATLYGTQITLLHGLLSNDPWSVTPIIQVGDEIRQGQKYGEGTAGETAGRRVREGLARREVAAGTVSALWLEFDVTHPSGAVETVRREIFDRIGLPARLDGRQSSAPLASLPMILGIPAPLLQVYGLSMASGIVYPDLGVGALLRLGPELAPAAALLASRRQSRETFTQEEILQIVRAFTPVIPTSLGILARSYHSLSTAAFPYSAGNDALIYAASPRLAIVAVGPTVAPDGTTIVPSLSIDLRLNTVRAVTQRSPGSPAVWANVRRGLYDGVLEHVLVGDLGAGWLAGVTASPIATFEEARRSGVDVVAVTRAEHLQSLQAADAVKARMRTGLSDGIVLVSPARPVSLNGAVRMGWWRIDLRSGETLAIMDNGLHTSSLERQKMQRKAEATAWALYEEWVVAFFGGNRVHAETARGLGMALYQLGRQAGAGPSPWPALISVAGLAGAIGIVVGFLLRGAASPPPPPPPPPPRASKPDALSQVSPLLEERRVA